MGDRFPLRSGSGSDAGAFDGRPRCDPGVHSPGSTSLKWGADGQLADLDLHNILARLCVHDQQICPSLDDGPVPQ